jgi:hypothetical protein
LKVYIFKGNKNKIIKNNFESSYKKKETKKKIKIKMKVGIYYLLESRLEITAGDGSGVVLILV